MKICRIDYNETIPYQKQAKKEHVSFLNNDKCEWYGIYDNGVLVSFYCFMKIDKKKARFKSNYTVLYYRKRGCLQEFIKHAKEKCREYGLSQLNCFATEMSINSHLRNGAFIKNWNSKYKFICYDLEE